VAKAVAWVEMVFLRKQIDQVILIIMFYHKNSML